MVMDSASQFLTPRPPVFDMKNKNSKFYQEVLAVKNAGDSLTDEQKHIAEFLFGFLGIVLAHCFMQFC